jgi:hypothetical protein
MGVIAHSINRERGVWMLYTDNFTREKTILYALEQFEQHG